MRIIIILLFLIFFFATAESFAQAGWILQNSGTTNNLYCISTFDGTNAIAVGEKGTVTITHNAGKVSWSLQQQPSLSNLYGVTSISKNLLFAVGRIDSVFRSTNSGTTWTATRSMAKGQCWTLDSLRYLWATEYDPSSKVCVAVGDQNEAVFSTDSGMHWQENLPYMKSGWHLSNLKCVSSDSGLVFSAGTSIGYLGARHLSQLFTTVNKGDDWINSSTDPQPRDTTVDFHGCDSKNYILVGTRGVIYRSPDKGGAWDSIPSGTMANLNAVRFAPDRINGFIAGDSGVILSTRDGGYTWTREFPPTKRNLHSVTLVDPFHAFICGDSGVILWTQDGGFNGVSSQSGDVAMNIQIFPNPLSAKTTIGVFLRQSRYVNLKIFNTLGVEIANIADNIFDQGPHNFEWNASEVPNGMYICRLESEGQIINSQMILAR